MTHIPYRGTALAVTDLLAGQVQVVFSDPISALQFVNSGALVALAVTSKDRSPVAPNGADDFRERLSRLRRGRVARNSGAGQDPARDRRQANAEIVQALKDPETRTAAREPGDPGRRQLAEGFCRLHQAGHRDLEGSGGPGQDRGEVTSPLIYQGPATRIRPQRNSASAASLVIRQVPRSGYRAAERRKRWCRTFRRRRSRPPPPHRPVRRRASHPKPPPTPTASPCMKPK